MSDYALYIDPNTHHKQYRRFVPRVSGSSEDFPDFENFKFDRPEASNNLKFAVSSQQHCWTVEHTIVVTYSTWLFYLHRMDSLLTRFCFMCWLNYLNMSQLNLKVLMVLLEVIQSFKLMLNIRISPSILLSRTFWLMFAVKFAVNVHTFKIGDRL